MTPQASLYPSEGPGCFVACFFDIFFRSILYLVVNTRARDGGINVLIAVLFGTIYLLTGKASRDEERTS